MIGRVYLERGKPVTVLARSGRATCVEIGFEGRSDYAAIGTVTNLASRLADEASGRQILIAQRLYAEVTDSVEVEPAGEFTLKGLPAARGGPQRPRGARGSDARCR